jgi:Putative phage tail protein
LYDPRTGLTAYSDNWALCVRDYLSNPDYGLGATDAEIDDDSVIASANICDEDVELADGTMQKRYICNGQLDTANSPLENIKDLVTAGAGIVPYTQGRFRIFAGAYVAPSATIDESWLADEIEIQAKTPRNELFNAVKGVYVAPDKNWQPTDFPMVKNSLYEAQDDGLQIPRDLELPYTIDPVAAQRIAKIVLEKARQGIVATMPCNFKALTVAVYDTVTVSIERLGWNEKVFRVTGWELTPEAMINLTLQEESSASYDWNKGEATAYDPAPDTNLAEAGSVEPPGNPVVTESLYETTDGSGVKTQVFLTWGESESPFISYYLVQYKLASEEEEDYRQEPPIYGNQHTIRDLAPGVYDFRVRAVNLRSSGSPYATTRKEVVGLNASPADIENFSINAINNQAHLTWDQSVDLDVRNGGYIRLRWSSDPGGGWSDGIDLCDALPGNATNAVLPLLSGVYMIKAYDSARNESINATLISSDIVNVVKMNSVATLAEDPGFSGTKTNMVVSSGELILDGTAGAIEMDGEYVFSTYLDLGAVYTARAYVSVTADVFDTISLFDSADGLFDDREGLFDGADLADVKLEFFIKTTSSNPSGSVPTDGMWNDWRKFVVGDFTARAYWLKLVVTNAKASNNIGISALALNVDVPNREEIFNDQALSSGGTTITYAKPFYARPTIGVTIQSASSGDTRKITHVTSGGKWTGVTVQILNGGGVARTVDVEARGY